MANLFDTDNASKTEPTQIIAGDRLIWKRTDLGTDYANGSYTLKYSARLEGTGSTEIEITASASGDDYLVEIASGTTASYTAGHYHWQAYITVILTASVLLWILERGKLSPTAMPQLLILERTPE